jgi:hypothetical protein
LEELPGRLLGSLLSDPQQPPATGGDLVDQREERPVARLPLDLVEPDRGDSFEILMGAA